MVSTFYLFFRWFSIQSTKYSIQLQINQTMNWRHSRYKLGWFNAAKIRKSEKMEFVHLKKPMRFFSWMFLNLTLSVPRQVFPRCDQMRKDSSRFRRNCSETEDPLWLTEELAFNWRIFHPNENQSQLIWMNFPCRWSMLLISWTKSHIN